MPIACVFTDMLTDAAAEAAAEAALATVAAARHVPGAAAPIKVVVAAERDELAPQVRRILGIDADKNGADSARFAIFSISDEKKIVSDLAVPTAQAIEAAVAAYLAGTLEGLVDI
jgi:hypothetical protein